MNPKLLDLYHALPPSLRDLAAAVEGVRLRRRRYGRGFEQNVAAIRERASWTKSDWSRYQRESLQQVLTRAVGHVPYYRRLAADHGLRADVGALSDWPVLEKDQLRAAPLDFVADDCRPSKLVKVYTSGTTGKPVSIFRSSNAEQVWYSMFEVRVQNYWGVSWRDRSATLGGRLVVPARQSAPPFWVHNRPLNQLYLSSYHISEANAGSYVRKLVAFEPSYLWVYTSAACALAQFIVSMGERRIRPKTIFTNAEPLHDHQRELLTEAYGCPIVETYGMTEMAVTGSQCRHGSLHYWPDLGYLELLDEEGSPVAPGDVGHVVCTTLLNQDQPLIRYRTGDLAVAMPDAYQCPCGSAMPVLARIEGRNDDVIVTRDGRRIGRLDPVFKSGLNIKEAQIVQEDWDLFTIRYVPAEGATQADAAQMVRELKNRVGDCRVVATEVPRIERTKNGKFRAVLSLVSGVEVGQGSSLYN